MMQDLDEKNQAILEHKRDLYMEVATDLSVGHWVRFQCGTMRRVSYIWDWPSNEDPPSIQTSKGGRYYLHNGYMTLSVGGLSRGLPREIFHPTDEILLGWCWFFSHNFPGAGRGIDVKVPCRVWECSEPAPKWPESLGG